MCVVCGVRDVCSIGGVWRVRVGRWGVSGAGREGVLPSLSAGPEQSGFTRCWRVDSDRGSRKWGSRRPGSKQWGRKWVVGGLGWTA